MVSPKAFSMLLFAMAIAAAAGFAGMAQHGANKRIDRMALAIDKQAARIVVLEGDSGLIGPEWDQGQ